MPDIELRPSLGHSMHAGDRAIVDPADGISSAIFFWEMIAQHQSSPNAAWRS
jgi:hypothetical protein